MLDSSMQLVVILDNIRSAYNVGSIIRSLACANGSELATCGYTPKYNHPKVAKTALQAEKGIKHQQFTGLDAALGYYQDEGFSIYALETGENVKNIWETDFKANPEGKVALVLGNEVEGVDLKTIDEFQVPVVEIPMLGSKGSLNVASAAAISIFEVARQYA